MSSSNYLLEVYYDCTRVTHLKSYSSVMLSGYKEGTYFGTANISETHLLYIDKEDPISVDSYSILEHGSNLLSYNQLGVTTIRPFLTLDAKKMTKGGFGGSYLIDTVTWTPQIYVDGNKLELKAVITSKLNEDITADITLIDGNLFGDVGGRVYSQKSYGMDRMLATVPLGREESGIGSYYQYELDKTLIRTGETHISLDMADISPANAAVVSVEYAGRQKGVLVVSFEAPWFIPSGEVYILKEGTLLGVTRSESYVKGEMAVLSYRPAAGVYATVTQESDQNKEIYSVTVSNKSGDLVYIKTSRLHPIDSRIVSELSAQGFNYYLAGSAPIHFIGT